MYQEGAIIPTCFYDYSDKFIPKQSFCWGERSYTNSVWHILMHLTPILKKSSVTAFDLSDCSSICLERFYLAKLKIIISE